MSDPLPGDTAAPRPWLAIVGIGEDGVDGLSLSAKELVEQAEHVFGGARHLALVKSLIHGVVHAWPNPFSINDVLALRGRRVCVLASGDPFHYGVGPLLAKELMPPEFVAIPNASAFSLAAAKLGWPLADTVLLSLHGRPVELIRPHLYDGARILALTADGEAPRAVSNLLVQFGFGGSILTVLEALNGPRERVRTARADEFSLAEIDPLNVLAVQVVAGPQAFAIPRFSGLPDKAFEHDGQLTKRDIRAVTLSALAGKPLELLWDIGAGAGSVAIEWMLAHPTMRAIAIERDPTRGSRITRNANALGVPGLIVVEGEAPAALAGLPAPDAVFIGCGTASAGLVAASVQALKRSGRLVINAVTLETEVSLLELYAQYGGELARLSVSHAEPIGSLTGWRPAMPITQWRWQKP